MKLQKCAEQMITFARQHPYTEGKSLQPYRRELPRGLTLTYVIEADRHQLALTRREVAPSEFEVDICRRAFAIPDRAERQHRQKGDFHHLTVTWSDEQPPLVTIAYPGDAEWLAVPHGRWRREGDKIVVGYRDHDELYWSVECSRLLKEALAKPETIEQASLFEENGSLPPLEKSGSN